MTLKKTLAAIVLLGAVVAVAGCAQSGTAAQAPASQTPASQPAETSAATNAEPPTIKVTFPAQGTTVPAGDVKATVETTNLEYTMPSNTTVPGQGHVHFTLDDRPFEMSVEPEFTFKDVTAGEHKLKAEVVQNDTSSFDPPVVQEITFVVE